MKQRFSVSAVLFALAIMVPVLQVKAAEVQASVLISAIKTDGSNTTTKPQEEFVSLYNAGATSVKLAGWEVEYAKQEMPLDTKTCATAVWQDQVTAKTVALDGLVIEPKASIDVPVDGMLDDKSGAVRLVQTAPTGKVSEIAKTYDVVGWGDKLQPRCVEKAAAKAAGDKQLLTRCINEQKVFSDTNDNAADFTVAHTTAALPPTCPVEPAPAAPKSDQCVNLQITEALPNPKGADEGNEFIEIHNKSKSVLSLDGCGLATGDGEEYLFPTGLMLQPGEYKALSDADTKILLTNNKNTELFVTSTESEDARTTYPAKLKDNMAWALVDSKWQRTDKPTPGQPNLAMTPEKPKKQIRTDNDVDQKPASEEAEDEEELEPCPEGKFRNPLTNRCKTIPLATASLTQCAPGQVRNPETNRCRSMTTAQKTTLTPCKAGQERNPETNRCRNVAIATASGGLTPCKPGQERNPATNRCKATTASTSDLKPCDPGEERNPETNRCRKVASVAGASTSKSGSMPSSQDQQAKKAPISYSMLGFVGASALSYGAYEYRTDLRNKLAKLKERLFGAGAGR